MKSFKKSLLDCKSLNFWSCFSSKEDILSIWNRTANDLAVTNRIRDTFRRVLNLPQGTVTEYKAHNDSIKDHSSFRNTDVFVR